MKIFILMISILFVSCKEDLSKTYTSSAKSWEGTYLFQKNAETLPHKLNRRVRIESKPVFELLPESDPSGEKKKHVKNILYVSLLTKEDSAVLINREENIDLSLEGVATCKPELCLSSEGLRMNIFVRDNPENGLEESHLFRLVGDSIVEDVTIYYDGKYSQEWKDTFAYIRN